MKRHQTSRTLLAVGPVLGFAVGLLVGRGLGGDPKRPAPTPVASSSAPGVVATQALPARRHGGAAQQPDADPRPRAKGAAPTLTADPRPATEAVAAGNAPGTFDGLLARYQAALAEDSSPAGPLADRLLTDDALRAEALERLRTSRDPQILAALATLLGQVHHPDVEAAAILLAQSGDAPLQAAALDILDAFDTPAAIPAVLPLLQGERDPNLVARAIHALPTPAGVAEETAQSVRPELLRRLSDPDGEVRRRAAIAYARWGAADAEAALIDTLRRDPDPRVRAAAAFGLELRRARSPQALEALAGAIARRGEAVTVRENAYQALQKAGPLPEAVLRVYRAYREEREGLGLGG